MHRSEECFFAWDGAAAAEGPWSHLLVLGAKGVEELNRPYEYVIDLAVSEGSPPVLAEDVLGSRATLKIKRGVAPAVRFVHGIVAEVEELGDVDGNGRLRVWLRPPYEMARMLEKSVIHVDKTLREIIDTTLVRQLNGMRLELSETRLVDDEVDDSNAWTSPKPTYAWRVLDTGRLMNPRARPYCVQYQESDPDFVARLLEDEGIAYHFEHTKTECLLVFSDSDLARTWRVGALSLGTAMLDREVRNLRLGGKLRPRAFRLVDREWRKPDLPMVATGGEPEYPTTIEQPGGFGFDPELGSGLANVRQERLDVERRSVSFTTACRAVSAGTVVSVEHANARYSKTLLIERLEVTIRQPGHFAVDDGKPSYEARVVAIDCAGEGDENVDSHYRPARLVRRPKITGTQTADVAAERGMDQEINVGGDADLGCVRLRFNWETAEHVDTNQPSSAWVRVSQMFAGGRGHGSMFHPRVGDEVIVEYLEGDPDRPIVVGRVYNGRNLSPENATHKPTYSCIKSMTSPFNGNYNMIAFDDAQGEEKFIVHVAKDYISNIEQDCTKTVMNLETIIIHGQQHTTIDDNQDITLKSNQSFRVAGHQFTSIGAGQDIGIVGGQNVSIQGDQLVVVSGTQRTDAAIIHQLSGVHAMTTQVWVTTAAVAAINAERVRTCAGSVATEAGSVATEAGTVTTVAAGQFGVTAGSFRVAAGTVDVTGGVINLNC